MTEQTVRLEKPPFRRWISLVLNSLVTVVTFGALQISASFSTQITSFILAFATLLGGVFGNVIVGAIVDMTGTVYSAMYLYIVLNISCVATARAIDI